MPLSDYAKKAAPAAAPVSAAPPSLSSYANGQQAISADTKNYSSAFNDENITEMAKSFAASNPVDLSTPATPPKQQNFIEKYNSFTDRMGQLASEFDVGIVRGVGSQILSPAAAIGNWLLTPVGKAIDALTGTKGAAPSANLGDDLTKFADELDKHTGVKDKQYLDDVAEGLGTAVPFIAGGAVGKALKVPALISSLGLGGLQALSVARSDYDQMVSNGDTNARAKAAGVFAVDLALNTAAHFLGPLAQGGGEGIMNSLGRVLKSTVFETANFGVAQTIVSNVANGRAPFQDVWHNALVMAPISAAMGGAGEVGNAAHIKAENAQIKSVIDTVASHGLSEGHAADALSHLAGVPRTVAEQKVTELTATDPDLQAKFQKNLTADLPKLEDVAAEVAKPAPTPEEAQIAESADRATKGFNGSIEQEPVGKVGDAEVVIGSFGNNAIERKTGAGQQDRLPKEELAPTLEKVTAAYKAGDSSFRKDNMVLVATMKNGEKRAIITRLNSAGKEEVVNFFKIGKDADTFVKNLEKFGAPAETRTQILSLEQKTPIQLADGGKPIVAEKTDTGSPHVDNVPTLEENLRKTYQDAGNGPLKGEKLPEPPTNPGEDNGFGQKEQTLEEHQAQIDEINSQPKAAKALKQIVTELEISEAGFRFMNEGTGEMQGVNSTFPKWIPEELRSKDLFEKVFKNLDPENLSYPSGNRPRLRRLYDLLLDEVDNMVGVDTKKIRSDILSAYDTGEKGGNPKSGGGRSEGGKNGGKSKPEVSRSKPFEDAAKSAESEGSFIATLKKNDAFNEQYKKEIAAGEMQARPGLKEFAAMSREQNARGSSFRLAKNRKGLGDWARVLDKELTPEERDAQAEALLDVQKGKEPSAKTQALLESGAKKMDTFIRGAQKLSLRMEKEAEKNGEPFDLTEEGARKMLARFFNPDEVDFLFHTDGYIKDFTGREALGMYTPGDALNNPLITLVMSDGKVQSKTLYEEAFHGYLDRFLTTAEREELFDRTKGHIATLPGRTDLRLDGYRSDEVAEEWLAHDFVKYASQKASFEGNKGFYQKIINTVSGWVRKLVGAQKVYDDALNKKRPAPRRLTVTSRMDDILSVRKSSEPEPFKDFEDLSTKLLGKLEGRTTVSKQFILDLTNSADLKQPEKDVIRETLETEGDTVKVADFADRVKAQLLPLERGSSESGGQYESINLPDDMRGPVSNYSEHIYNSPIETSAGNVHFSQAEDGAVKGYFAHTRVEDLPDESMLDEIEAASMFGGGKKAAASAPGDTRRIIELQSDLFQKGNLEREVPRNLAEVEDALTVAEMRKYRGLASERSDIKLHATLTPQNLARIDEINAEMAPMQKKIDAFEESRKADVAKLEPFRNTWQERIVREEVKQAAIDGKTKLQFPTGETALKIEGLGDTSTWLHSEMDADGKDNSSTGEDLTPQSMKVGDMIQREDDSSPWIITDVLGDGKFKAMPKEHFDSAYGESTGHNFDNYADQITYAEHHASENFWGSKETFDVSGKVDTDSPIYKFYQKELGKYLKNKYGAKEVTDAQGVSWYEVDVKPEEAKKPVAAYHLRKPNDDGSVSDEEMAAAFFRSTRAQESKPATREEAKTKPVYSNGEEIPSRAFERVKERLGEEEGVTYNRMDMAKDTENAIRFVDDNPEVAKRIAVGAELPPEGMTETAISIAYSEKMIAEGKYQDAADAERARSLRQTRRGQEIVAERGRFNENAAPTFIRRVMQARLDNLGRSKIKYIESLKGKTPREAASKVIEGQAKDLAVKLKERQLRIRDAQDLLTKLTCA